MFLRRVLPLLAVPVLQSMMPNSAASQSSPPELEIPLERDDVRVVLSPTIAQQAYFWEQREAVARLGWDKGFNLTLGCGPQFVNAEAEFWPSELSWCNVRNVEAPLVASDQPLLLAFRRILSESDFYLTPSGQQAIGKFAPPKDMVRIWTTVPTNIALAIDQPAIAAFPERRVTADLVERYDLEMSLRNASTLSRGSLIGDLEISCFIHVDLSISCRAESYSSDAVLDFFERHLRPATLGVQMRENLLDGSPAVGARFTVNLAYRE